MSKFTKFVVGTIVALGAVIAVHGVSNAAYVQTTTLQYGSSSSQVMALQQTLNMTSCKVAASGAGSPGMETSYFGSETKAAVQCFQAANGLTADGIVGPMTGAKLALVATTGTVSTGLPAGCSSTAGYSTTTGAPCSGTPSTTVFPAGCVSSVGYSSTTGQACSGTSTVVSGGPLSINQITAGSGYSNTNVGVGASNTQVADLRIVTGAGGSGNLTGLNVTFTNVGTGNFQFTQYASAVSVWYNGVQVGSLPASSFTEYNSAYSAYIPLSGAMLNPSTTSDLYIAVSALPVIDSANLSTTENNWAISGVSLRYSDSTGSAFQYSNISTGTITGAGSSVTNALANTNFTFNSAASADSIKLTVTKDVNDSTDHTVQVSSSSNTQNVQLAVLDLNAQGANVTLSRLPVTVEIAGGTPATDVSQVLSTLRLYNSSGVQLDSEPINVGSTTACSNSTFNPNGLGGPSLSGTSGAVCATVTFQNFSGSTTSGVTGLTIPANTTSVFTVKGDVNTLSGSNFTAGTYAVAEVTPTNMNNVQAYDQNGNLLPGATNSGATSSLYLLGSTTGSKNYFYANGINVAAAGSTTNTYSNPGGSQSHGIFTMTIPFSVTSYGQTSYIPATTQIDTTGNANAVTASAGHFIQFAVDNGTNLQSGATATITYTGNDNLTVDTNGNYQIPVGQTKTFDLVITYTPSASGSYRGQLVNVNSNTTDATSGFSAYTAGLNTNAFRTAYVAGQ
jgi:peptidoglycan hydrolase-like protein with peptidoglycan-binding domain